MSDVEHLLTQVRTPDVRPLVGEAWICYSAAQSEQASLRRGAR
ncbi:hypothetical protein OIE68_45495 [Nocardia vinacea]|nr:hypothetical protein OIE68_45495 [Nocardia vinacea]